MAEIIHEHTVERPAHSSHGTGFLLGIILLIVLLYVLFAYGLPVLRSATSGPNIQVPGRVDVNVNNPAPK